MVSTPDPVRRETVLDDLPFHLARTASAFRQFNDRTLGAVGLKPQAPGLASVLHALESTEDCTVNSLVEKTHLPNGTLTGLLDSLERDRCIERVRNPKDGRSWRVRLTKKGHRLCAKLHERHELVMGMFRDVLLDSEMEQLNRLLDRVTEHMRAYRADQSGSASF